MNFKISRIKNFNIFLLCIILIVLIFSTVIYSENYKNETILVAKVIGIREDSLLISSYDNKFKYIINLKDTEIKNKYGQVIDISTIKKNEKIKIVYDGTILEKSPAVINNVYEIYILNTI